jgi:hypothetical protein
MIVASLLLVLAGTVEVQGDTVKLKLTGVV